MKKLSFFVILLAILSFILVSCQKGPSNPVETTLSESNPTALAKAETHFTQFTGTTEVTIFIPCAVDGIGENVEFSGTYYDRIHWITNENKDFEAVNRHFDSKLTGVGQTTGDKYQSTHYGESSVYRSSIKDSRQWTIIEIHTLIGHGTDGTHIYRTHLTWHVTMNGNGTENAYLSKYTVDCKSNSVSIPYLGVTPSSVSLGSSTNSQSAFNISSNTSWSVSDDASWLTVSPTSGSGNGTVTVTAISANISPSSRSATVTISGSGLSNRTVTVTQSGMSYSCYPNLPNPSLRYTGSEDYSTESGNFTRYNLTVDNFSSFPNELFNEAPDLPPCGLNNNPSRSWVEIYDNNSNYLYGFCGLSSSSDLQGLWFSLPRGQNPPSAVYIIISDRRCYNEYKSNSISIP